MHNHLLGFSLHWECPSEPLLALNNIKETKEPQNTGELKNIYIWFTCKKKKTTTFAPHTYVHTHTHRYIQKGNQNTLTKDGAKPTILQTFKKIKPDTKTV